MKYTIGVKRSDGDIDVIATFNGENALCPTPEHAKQLAQAVRDRINDHCDALGIEVFERDDVPDVISVEE